MKMKKLITEEELHIVRTSHLIACRLKGHQVGYYRKGTYIGPTRRFCYECEIRHLYTWKTVYGTAKEKT